MNLWNVSEPYHYGITDFPVAVAYWSYGSDEAIDVWKAEYRRDAACADDEIPIPVVNRVDIPLGIKLDAATEPRFEDRPIVLQLCGWSYDGDRQCDHCGLWEMGLNVVCDECGACDECGCECGDGR